MANTSGYKPLKTVFHASRHGHSALEKEYARRLDSPATLQWEFDVAGYPLFLVMTVELAAQLEKIWHTELRISDKWAALPGIGRQHYLLGILISEIRATNAIEGIFSTRKEIASALERPSTTAHKRFREMAGLYRSLLVPDSDRMEFPATVQQLRGLYDDLLAHEIAADDAPDGKHFRRHEVTIFDGTTTLHRAPGTEEDIEHRMDTFLRTQLSAENSLVHALVGHFMFEYTHPFYDGNGRLGRFLLAFRLLDVLPAPTAMSLSHQFSVQRAKYYSAFHQAEHSLNRGEVTFFVKAIADLIGDAQVELEESLDEKCVQFLNLEDRLEDAELSDYQKAILSILGQAFLFGPHEPVSLHEITQYMAKHWNTVRPVADELVTQGCIREVSKKPLSFELTDKAIAILGLDAA